MPSYDPSMADDTATYLVANDLGVKGRTLFVNNLPADKVDVFLVTDTGGSKPEQYYAIDHPSVQVAYYAAAKNHGKGMQKIWDAYRLLNRKQNIAIGGRDAMYVQAVAPPQSLGLDTEKNRWVFVFNVTFKIRAGDGQ